MELVHSAHAGTSGCAIVFLWEIDDEGAHSNGGGCDADSVLDSFAGDAGWIDDTSLLEVDKTFFWSHNVDALAIFGVFNLSKQSLRIEACIFHDLDKWSLEGVLEDGLSCVVVLNALAEVD